MGEPAGPAHDELRLAAYHRARLGLPADDGPYIGMHIADCRVFDFPKAELCITDPPWKFDQSNGQAPPYEPMETDDIVTVLFERLRWKRLACWCTGAIMGEVLWAMFRRGFPPPVTFGGWDKGSIKYGQGYHWASRDEFLMLFTRGSGPNFREVPLDNGYNWSPPAGMHSYKPPGWQAQMIRRWTGPGDVIIDPFLGLGSTAHAVDMVPGRAFIGTELDPERWCRAVQSLHNLRRSRDRKKETS